MISATWNWMWEKHDQAKDTFKFFTNPGAGIPDDRDRAEDIRAHQRRPRRNQRAGIMSDDHRDLAVAQRIDEPDRIAHHVQYTELIWIAVIGIVPTGRAPVTALVRRDDVIARLRERQHHVAPAVRELGKPM